MRPKATFLLLATAILAALAVAGWGWGWREHRRASADSEFVRRRLALLEEENGRLRKVITDRASTEELAADRAKRTAIERDVERLRAMKFVKPVVYREIPRSELPALLRQKLAQQVPDQEFGDTGTALAALGLLPQGIDLKKTYLDLLGEQIGAFYDQHAQELFTFSGQSLAGAQNRVIMAHELTHALEDQHFNLSRLPLEAKGNDDRAIASSALVEGDATLVMNQYMLGDLSAASIRDTLATTFTTDVRQLAAAPRYLRETLVFPYLQGLQFCQTLYETGGWEALAKAFAHPPASTAQILHAERFLAEPREEPLAVDFPDVNVLGQSPIADNVLGEFGSRQLFLAWLHDEARASDAAGGWRGDRYLVYRQDGVASYAWKIVCRDGGAAARFYGAVQATVIARYHLAGVTTEHFPVRKDHLAGFDGKSSWETTIINAVAWQHGEREIKVCQTGSNEVIVIDAQNRLWSGALAERFAPGVQFSHEN